MIGHMRHGSPPRLMALQLILSPNRRESLPTGSAGVRMSRIKGRTHVSTRPRATLLSKISLAPQGASTHVAKFENGDETGWMRPDFTEATRGKPSPETNPI